MQSKGLSLKLQLLLLSCVLNMVLPVASADSSSESSGSESMESRSDNSLDSMENQPPWRPDFREKLRFHILNLRH